ARPPFTAEHEAELMRAHGITHLVTRNSGGAEGRAKLAAAARLGLPVVIVSRPPPPAGETVATVAEALARIGQIAQQGRP
ncbi:MAG: precorrin-6A/cobalt-precorrin-6A reductase, partial [Paracoccaceae bacterium]